MVKIALDIGHNCYPDLGAVGIGNEDKMNLAVGQVVNQRLTKRGMAVILTKPTTVNSVMLSLQRRVTIANEMNCNYFISIHHNAYNSQANGSEVFAISKVGQELASCVLHQLTQLGFSNRGVKDGSNLYVVSATKMPAILVECCFVDSMTDMKKWDSKKVGNAISRGIFDFFAI